MSLQLSASALGPTSRLLQALTETHFAELYADLVAA